MHLGSLPAHRGACPCPAPPWLSSSSRHTASLAAWPAGSPLLSSVPCWPPSLCSPSLFTCLLLPRLLLMLPCVALARALWAWGGLQCILGCVPAPTTMQACHYARMHACAGASMWALFPHATPRHALCAPGCPAHVGVRELAGYPGGIQRFPMESCPGILSRRRYVPAMMDPILGDYARNNPDAR